MPMFNLIKTFFTPVTVGKKLINMGVRSMSSISTDFLERFTIKIKQESMIFEKIKPNRSGVAYRSSFEGIPISICVNADFPEAPLLTVCAKFTDRNESILQPLFSAEDLNQLPHGWQIPRNQPKLDASFK